MRRIRRALLNWLPVAASLVLLSGFVYLTMQGSLRSSAEDPQIQMAEDAARILETQPVDSFLPAETVELSESLAPYWMVFDAQGNLLTSNARLYGRIPKFLKGPLDAARQKGQNRITWQPEVGVRSAVVIIPVAGGEKGFVMAGRSLREVERRIELEGRLVGTGLVVSLIASLAVSLLADWLKVRFYSE